MVSPYLLKPVRALKEVLVMTEASLTESKSTRSPLFYDRDSVTAAALLRRKAQGHRLRVVWVNDSDPPEQRTGLKPGKKD